MQRGDIVTIGAPFGDDTTEFVVSGVLDADTSQVWQGMPLAFGNQYLTKVGEGGELPTDARSARLIRDWEFRNRFTQTQLIGIMRAAMGGDDVAALVWLKLSTASDGIDLDDPDNIGGMQYVAATYPALAIDPAVILA